MYTTEVANCPFEEMRGLFDDCANVVRQWRSGQMTREKVLTLMGRRRRVFGRRTSILGGDSWGQLPKVIVLGGGGRRIRSRGSAGLVAPEAQGF